MLHTPYFLLDVFTDRLFGGNPLAIFTDARAIPERWLALIARELNLSETVFIYPSEEKKRIQMRIFTPASEMPTAGHPTIGTALFLARELDHPDHGTIDFTLVQPIGDIPVQVFFENNLPVKATMIQPLPTFGTIYSQKAPFAQLLSLAVDDLDADLPIQEVSCGNNTLLIPCRSADVLAKIQFNMSHWSALRPQLGSKMVYPFATKDVKGGAVQGRMFAPDLGIAEDPATGSSNGPLACYLHRYRVASFPLVSLQGIEMGRPSTLHLDVLQNGVGEITQVQVGGSGVFVGKGEIFLDFD